MAEQVAIEEGLFTWLLTTQGFSVLNVKTAVQSYSLCNQVALDALQMTQSPKS